MTRLVLDASAGVDLLLNTPESAEWWVPEHYFVEVAGALRRAALSGDATSERVDRAFSMLDRAVARRAQIRPLLADAWARRATMTVAFSSLLPEAMTSMPSWSWLPISTCGSLPI